MRFKTFESFFFLNLILIGNLFFLLIFLKKTLFFFNPTLILKSNCITSRAVNQNINMKNCLIKDISSNSNGGAIYIDTMLSININETTFYNCITTSGHGGAIYFINGLNINLFKICAVGCKSTFHYQFAFLKTSSNQILDLITIFNCSNLNGYVPLIIYNGNQNISNLNVSYNNNVVVSGIEYAFPNSMFSNYCTFYNNTASTDRCIYLNGNICTISKSNIILNNSPSTNYGVVYLYSGNIILKECIFDQNKDILLYANSGSTLQLINCYYLTGSSSIYGSVANSLIITNTNYYLYSIYSTYYCSYSNPKLNPTISKTNFITLSFTFYIIIFFK